MSTDESQISEESSIESHETAEINIETKEMQTVTEPQEQEPEIENSSEKDELSIACDESKDSNEVFVENDPVIGDTEPCDANLTFDEFQKEINENETFEAISTLYVDDEFLNKETSSEVEQDNKEYDNQSDKKEEEINDELQNEVEFDFYATDISDEEEEPQNEIDMKDKQNENEEQTASSDIQIVSSNLNEGNNKSDVTNQLPDENVAKEDFARDITEQISDEVISSEELKSNESLKAETDDDIPKELSDAEQDEDDDDKSELPPPSASLFRASTFSNLSSIGASVGNYVNMPFKRLPNSMLKISPKAHSITPRKSPPQKLSPNPKTPEHTRFLLPLMDQSKSSTPSNCDKEQLEESEYITASDITPMQNEQSLLIDNGEFYYFFSFSTN